MKEYEHHKHDHISHKESLDTVKEQHKHEAHKTNGGSHASHHVHMVQDFKRRFWICLILTIPVLVLSPMLQHLIGFEVFRFPGSICLLFVLSTIIYLYGGYPFLKGLVEEVKKSSSWHDDSYSFGCYRSLRL